MLLRNSFRYRAGWVLSVLVIGVAHGATAQSVATPSAVPTCFAKGSQNRDTLGPPGADSWNGTSEQARGPRAERVAFEKELLPCSHADVLAARDCEALRCAIQPASTTPRQETASSSRATYAVIGFVVGAAVGWTVGARQCQREDCVFPTGGVLLAVGGGVLGMVIGLLLAPEPGS